MKKKTALLITVSVLIVILLGLLVYMTMSFRKLQLNTSNPGIEGADIKYLEGLRGKSLFSASSKAKAHFANDPFIERFFVEFRFPGELVVSIAYRDGLLAATDGESCMAVCTQADYMRTAELGKLEHHRVLECQPVYMNWLQDKRMDESLWIIGVYNENLDQSQSLICRQDYVYNPDEDFGTWTFYSDRASLSVKDPVGLAKLNAAWAKVQQSPVSDGRFSLYEDALVQEASEE